MHIILIVIIVAVLLLLLIKNASPALLRKVLIVLGVGLGVFAAILLIRVTGSFLAGLLPVAIPVLLRYLGRPTNPDQPAEAATMEVDSTDMDQQQALAILGLQAGATEQDIKNAHKRLMQKNHPDQGGSTYLAAQINRAKRILLNE